MFQISDVSCRSGSHISHFTYTQPRGTTHVLLSQNADYLDGLQGILTGNEPYSGEIALNGRRYAVQRAAFMTRTFRMYREQTVIANVLTDLGFRQLGGKKGQRLFSALTEETGLSLDPSRTISQMAITEQKMVELLRIFDQKPELLIIRGLSSFVSVDMFQKMMQLVERLNEAGWFERTPPYTTVLCYPVRISGENAQLMGNAVLLRESHHRIKNNLQVVVNLLELEKELLPANVGDPAARTGMEQSFDGAIQRIKCIAGVHDLLTMRKFGSTCEIGEIAGTVCEFYQNCAQTHWRLSRCASHMRRPSRWRWSSTSWSATASSTTSVLAARSPSPSASRRTTRPGRL